MGTAQLDRELVDLRLQMIAGGLGFDELLANGAETGHQVVNALLALLRLVLAPQGRALALLRILVQLAPHTLQIRLQGLNLRLQAPAGVGVIMLAIVEEGLQVGV